jgi:putative ABC transport system permease protein
MSPLDLLGFTLLTLRRQRFRSLMLILSLALGVSSVTLLVSLGEAARGYVLGEFSLLGSDVLAVFPGRKSTSGGMPPVTGTAARDITLNDARIIEKTVPGVHAVAALVVGSAPASHEARERDTLILGTSAAFFDIRQISLARGKGWPELEIDEVAPVAVIGETVERELFGQQRSIGQWLRVRDYRFRVVGVIEGSGDSFGADLSDAVFIPVASAQQLFNTPGLFRLIVQVDPLRDRDAMISAIERRMQALHDGELDVTVVNPDSLLASLSDILRMMTLAVAGIAAISLVVAGVLVMNLTLMSVQQRTAEIGLLKAVGADSSQVRLLFITEAILLAIAGIIVGFLLAIAALRVAVWAMPDLPFTLPWWALLAVSLLTLMTAVVFAWRPSAKAAAMTPVSALGRGA